MYVDPYVAVTGNELVGFGEEDINDDFDPNSHDEKMSRIFGDDYYGQDEEEKPVFPSDEGTCIIATRDYAQYALSTKVLLSVLHSMWNT